VLSNQKEVTTLYRDKIEELYELTLGLKAWNDRAVGRTVEVFGKIRQAAENIPDETAKWDEECPINRITMLVDLYFPGLQPDLANLSDAESRLRNGFFEFLKKATSSGEVMRALREHIEIPQETVSRAIDNFKVKLSNKTHKIK
jgi:hypothetical protein